MDSQIFIDSSVPKLQKNLFFHLKQLAGETDSAKKSNEMLLYLNFCSKFYRYSANNIWLILMQRPQSSFLAGYSAWKKLGRYVIRGQKGIVILAPLIVKEENLKGEIKNHLIGFKRIYVYDITQTSGKALPKPPNWKSLGQNEFLRSGLMKYAMSKGISVLCKEFRDDTQGVSMGGKIILSPTAGVKTLAHELAHEVLHAVESRKLSRVEMEMEAESTAFVICRYFGIGNLACPNYIALQGGTGEEILLHCQRILQAASEIIAFIENFDA